MAVANAAGIELASGEHPVVEAEGPRLLELLRGAGGAHHGAAGHPAELHGRGAHTRADRVHEQDLARLHRALRDEGIVRGDEHLGHTTRGDEVDRLGHRRALRRGDREQLGLSAAAGDAEHARADRRFGDAVALGDHLARELEAGDVGR